MASKTVEFPADLPYVTGVGGSSVFIGSKGQWLGEQGWPATRLASAKGFRVLEVRRQTRD